MAFSRAHFARRSAERESFSAKQFHIQNYKRWKHSPSTVSTRLFFRFDWQQTIFSILKLGPPSSGYNFAVSFAIRLNELNSFAERCVRLCSDFSSMASALTAYMAFDWFGEITFRSHTYLTYEWIEANFKLLFEAFLFDSIRVNRIKHCGESRIAIIHEITVSKMMNMTCEQM